MENVLTLIGSPPALDEPLIERVRAALQSAGAGLGMLHWLDPGHAVDLPFSGIEPVLAEAAALKALERRPVDLIAQRAEGRRKKILIADMDATIVAGETLDELAAIAGIGAKVAAITARAMNGEIDFAAALKERIALLYGLPVSVLEQVLPRIAYNPGAVTLVHTMRKHGAYAVLVSGGFKYFTSRVRAQCGFDEDRANELEIRDGRLTGRVIEPILGRRAKLDALNETAAKLGVSPDAALAVGDGANDLEMIVAAGLGVAYRAKPAVAAAARARIEHADLTALLFAQGYRRAEFT